MRTYPKILDILKDRLHEKGSEEEYQQFAQHMKYLFNAHVKHVQRKTDHIVELTIQAPLVAKHIKPGQFCRLQNFETYAPHYDHTLLQMEPLALVTAESDPQQGLLNFIVNENSAAAKLCSTLTTGESVSLMGPAGVRAKTPNEHETILILGTPASFAFLRSYGSVLRKAGNRVLYLIQFKQAKDIYCQAQLEDCADTIIWLSEQGEDLIIRDQDILIKHTDFISALTNYSQATLKNAISLHDVDRIYLVGNTELLRRFQTARKTLLKDYFLKNPPVLASVYGNMQCMLKGVCAQCLQWQIDPETGQRTKAVFACSWQDQPLEIIDIDHMDARQFQNRLHEHINKLWVDHIFNEYDIPRV